MRIFLSLIVGLALVAGLLPYVLAPIDPVAWEPAPNPGLSGDFAPNNRLADARRLLEGVGSGPEGVACGPDGELYTGLDDGRILAFDAAGNHREVANTGGRPLGMKLDSAGRLIVADGQRGLLAVSPTGDVEVLVDTVNGQRLLFVDDLDIATDGTIWFSDASSRHDHHHSLYDFLEGRPSGRLLSYSPASGETRVHLEALFFANGVALGPDDSYVLVTETGSGRIHRLWLSGEQAGQRDLFHTGLPGTPDNVTFNGTDTFWVAMPSSRAWTDVMATKPFLRRVMSLLPEKVLNAGTGSFGFVAGLGLDGSVRTNLQGDTDGFVFITSAIECHGALYLGSLVMPAVARLPLQYTSSWNDPRGSHLRDR